MNREFITRFEKISFTADGKQTTDIEVTGQLVRCKNCVFWEQRYPNEQGFMCCHQSGMDITENDYCSWGEYCGSVDGEVE